MSTDRIRRKNGLNECARQLIREIELYLAFWAEARA